MAKLARSIRAPMRSIPYWALLAVFGLSACSNLQTLHWASVEEDRAAKALEPDASHSLVYVYRQAEDSGWCVGPTALYAGPHAATEDTTRQLNSRGVEARFPLVVDGGYVLIVTDAEDLFISAADTTITPFAFSGEFHESQYVNLKPGSTAYFRMRTECLFRIVYFQHIPSLLAVDEEVGRKAIAASRLTRVIHTQPKSSDTR
jgi:hypothetical protein